jgi:hypothetical protein
MVVYNVTVNIDEEVHDDWLEWMIGVHIPDILKTGLFIDARISRLDIEEEKGGVTYSIQYTLQSQQHLDEYQEKHAPDLQQQHRDRYEGKFVAFRTVMEVISHQKF